MEHAMFVALLCYSYCRVITAGADGLLAGDVEIEKCSGNVIDIQENANNAIICKGFNRFDTIVWTLAKSDGEILEATCYHENCDEFSRGPLAKCDFYCTDFQSDHFAVERSPSHSTLFYQQYDREVDKETTVTCASHFGTSRKSMACKVNVINPAELSRCTVEEDRDRGTVTGSCRFDHAYSFRREFTCTWYQENVWRSRPFRGNITYDSGSIGPSGWCTFTSTGIDWAPGTYTYSINFYPGPGKVAVNIGSIDTNRPTSTRGTTTAISSPDVSLPTTKDSVDYGQHAENVKIENCNKGFIDIREKANNSILCSFYPLGTIVWTFKRNGMEIQVAVCGPIYCSVYHPDHFAVQWLPPHSTLFYQQYDREEDKSATVTCENRFGQSRSMNCKLNVINPATLSSCTVEEDRERGTVTGSCRFDHAYSFSREFTCAWYQKNVFQFTQFPGTISSTSGSVYKSGWCAFTSTDINWDLGNYNYSINFYPGPGKISVSVVNIDNNRPKPTRGSTSATSSPEVSPPSNNVEYTSPKTQEEDNLPLGAIVGGIVTVVAVVIVVVVVVVVCVRRKRKQKAAGSTHWSGNDNATDNDDFEEHVNAMHVTSEDPDVTHSTDHKPSAIALQISPNSHNGHPAAPHSLDADVYTIVDDEARYAPSSEADRSGGYEDVGFDSNGNKRASQKDEYAVVDKSRAKKGPASSANTSASSPTHTTEGNNEYAVVDKSSSRNKAAKKVASGLSAAATSNAGADVYAQVNKSVKKVKVAEPKTKGAAYAQVQKPKPAAKPKISAKPSSDKDVAQRGAADDDEYHTLSHTRGSPHTQDQADLESQYSHIGYN